MTIIQCSVGRTSPPLDETWEACGNIVRDADSIEVCEVKLWRASPSNDAKLIARAVNTHDALLSAAKDAAVALERVLILTDEDTADEVLIAAAADAWPVLANVVAAVRKAEAS